MLKKTIYTVYIALILCMGTATIVEKYHGTAYVGTHIYGSWWFTVLWAVLAAASVALIVRRFLKRRSVTFYMLHFSLLLILAGALVTHLTAWSGVMHLRTGQSASACLVGNGQVEKPLPFAVRLDSFQIKYHQGTAAPSDFMSHLTVTSGRDRVGAVVSMNRVFTYRSIRFYQNSYDPDGQGSVLALSSDPVGIPLTYCGYALLFLALIYMLIDPRGPFRTLLRHPLLRQGLCVALLLGFAVRSGAEPRVLPRETAHRFGELFVVYGNRVCPMQTLAVDFTKKLYGKPRYRGFSAEQVFTGFLFFGDQWSDEPVLKVKAGPLGERLGMGKYLSFTELSRRSGSIDPFVQAFYSGRQEKINRQAAELVDKFNLVMSLWNGPMLKIFPETRGAETVWHAPIGEQDAGDNAASFLNTLRLLYEDAQSGQFARFDSTLTALKQYQLRHAGHSLPSETKVSAERMYNAVPFATVLFMFNLTLGFLSLFLTLWRLTRRSGPCRWEHWADRVQAVLLFISFAALTMALVLRWTVSGRVPMSNGYETMLTMAWFILLFTLLMCRRFRVMFTFGFLLSGFFLLVSHISQMDPQIGPLMPVLNSPLLSLHVSVIMMGYALLALTFICGLMALIIKLIHRLKPDTQPSVSNSQLTSLQLLSRLFLYPALTALGLGIFIGAIWANISWGTYWSWDPKETWALISFMVYAIPAHTRLLPRLQRPVVYHVFMVFAFLTLLMTYFGVNYFLGGMHSYA